MNRRAFLLGGASAVVLVACSGDDDTAAPSTSITTVPGPGSGNPDDVLLRTGAALSLTAAVLNPGLADAHRQQAALLDATIAATHPQADATWTTPADAERALAATFQAWTAVLSTPALRQLVMSCGAACARFVAVAVAQPPSLPEAFQLTDAAVPDDWLLR